MAAPGVHPPPMPVTTFPVPLQSGQVFASNWPLPLQRGQRFSPVPGVPGGASSPGFVGSADIVIALLV